MAEIHRTPFDFIEGESELVSGFNVEYGGGGFTLLFIAEYVSILINSALTVALLTSPLGLFFAHPLLFGVLSAGLAALLVLVRASLPRLRYDRLMRLTWTCCLPFAICVLALITGAVGLMTP